MDSGNSSSMQSSGDEEEYNSRSRSRLVFQHNNMNPPLDPELVFNWTPTPPLDPIVRPDPNTNNYVVSFSAPPAAAAIPKNPKKRTRASRRAPTTVMTTDTTNFRAMVQEFTGIPDPPFSSSSSSSRRLNLGSSIRLAAAAGMNQTQIIHQPPSLLFPPPPPNYNTFINSPAPMDPPALASSSQRDAQYRNNYI